MQGDGGLLGRGESEELEVLSEWRCLKRTQVDGTGGANARENGRGRARPAPPHPGGHPSRPLRNSAERRLGRRLGGAAFFCALEGTDTPASSGVGVQLF